MVKRIFEPIEVNKIKRTIMVNEAVNFSGVMKIASGELDFDPINDLMILGYITQKQGAVRQQIKNLEDSINKLNRAVKIAGIFGAFQNLYGEPLKKLELEVKEKYV